MNNLNEVMLLCLDVLYEALVALRNLKHHLPRGLVFHFVRKCPLFLCASAPVGGIVYAECWHHCPQSSSASRFTAEQAGFFILSPIARAALVRRLVTSSETP